MDINKNIKNFNANVTKTVKTHLPLQLQYIFGVYFLGIFFMMLYRLATFAIHCFVSFSDINIALLLQSLLVGLRFDTVVLCWTLSVFLLFMVVGAIFNINKKWYYRPLHLFLCFLFLLMFCIIAADIVYFIYFKTHINIIALSWIQSPSYVVSLIFRHPIYLLYFAVFLFSIAWYTWLMYCLYNATLFKVIPPYEQKIKLGKTIGVSFIVIILCGLVMFPKMAFQKPTRVSSAYFSKSDFFNQLAISPLFNFEKSIEEETFSYSAPLAVVDGVTAKKTVEEQFFFKNDEISSCPTLPPSTNVIFIMVEDLSLQDINSNKTPYLKELSSKSIYFTNLYPDGENVHNGIFSTLFAYHNILSAHSMTSALVPKFNGIPDYLHSINYSNLFFTTKEQENNHMFSFLYRNDFDKIIIKQNLYAEDEIADIFKQKNNFFACIVINKDSIGNHKKYADNYIKRIIQNLKYAPSDINILFAISGCNGKDKIPLIMYMPKYLKPEKVDNIATQTDITPTLLTMLNNNYTNENTLGLNIFSGQRTFAVSSYPHNVIVRNNQWKYIWHDNGNESLYYNDSDKDRINYFNVNFEQAKRMKKYAFSMLQTTQYNIARMKMQRK